MSRKRTPRDGPSPPDLPEGLGKWAIPPEDYHDLFMPDDPGEIQRISIPSMGTKAACARVEDVCAGVQALINMIPTYLPIEGDPPQGPQLDGAGRRSIVNECFRRINLPVGDWLALGSVLPKSARIALRTLSRTIDGNWRRWEWAETEYGRAKSKAQLAKKRGKRLPAEVPPPLRSVQRQELTWLQQALAIVREAVDAERLRKNRGAEPEQKRRVSDKDDARSKWIYEKLIDINIPQKAVLDEFKKVARDKGWRPIGTVNGLIYRAKDYAKRHDLPSLPRRQDK
jgi:hypothetical protein